MELMYWIKAISHIGAIQKKYSGEEVFSILYLTPKVNEVFQSLSSLFSITQ